jgi:sulfide:quinone oxidoreductase
MLSESKKPMRDVIPQGAEWIQGKFAEADPEANKITLADGRSLTYDFLVMAAGEKPRHLRLFRPRQAFS